MSELRTSKEYFYRMMIPTVSRVFSEPDAIQKMATSKSNCKSLSKCLDALKYLAPIEDFIYSVYQAAGCTVKRKHFYVWPWKMHRREVNLDTNVMKDLELIHGSQGMDGNTKWNVVVIPSSNAMFNALGGWNNITKAYLNKDNIRTDYSFPVQFDLTTDNTWGDFIKFPHDVAYLVKVDENDGPTYRPIFVRVSRNIEKADSAAQQKQSIMESNMEHIDTHFVESDVKENSNINNPIRPLYSACAKNRGIFYSKDFSLSMCHKYLSIMFECNRGLTSTSEAYWWYLAHSKTDLPEDLNHLRAVRNVCRQLSNKRDHVKSFEDYIENVESIEIQEPQKPEDSLTLNDNALLKTLYEDFELDTKRERKTEMLAEFKSLAFAIAFGYSIDSNDETATFLRNNVPLFQDNQTITQMNRFSNVCKKLFDNNERVTKIRSVFFDKSSSDPEMVLLEMSLSNKEETQLSVFRLLYLAFYKSLNTLSALTFKGSSKEKLRQKAFCFMGKYVLLAPQENLPTIRVENQSNQAIESLNKHVEDVKRLNEKLQLNRTDIERYKQFRRKALDKRNRTRAAYMIEVVQLLSGNVPNVNFFDNPENTAPRQMMALEKRFIEAYKELQEMKFTGQAVEEDDLKLCFNPFSADNMSTKDILLDMQHRLMQYGETATGSTYVNNVLLYACCKYGRPTSENISKDRIKDVFVKLGLYSDSGKARGKYIFKTKTEEEGMREVLVVVASRIAKKLGIQAPSLTEVTSPYKFAEELLEINFTL